MVVKTNPTKVTLKVEKNKITVKRKFVSGQYGTLTPNQHSSSLTDTKSMWSLLNPLLQLLKGFGISLPSLLMILRLKKDVKPLFFLPVTSTLLNQLKKNGIELDRLFVAIEKPTPLGIYTLREVSLRKTSTNKKMPKTNNS